MLLCAVGRSFHTYGSLQAPNTHGILKPHYHISKIIKEVRYCRGRESGVGGQCRVTRRYTLFMQVYGIAMYTVHVSNMYMYVITYTCRCKYRIVPSKWGLGIHGPKSRGGR